MMLSLLDQNDSTTEGHQHTDETQSMRCNDVASGMYVQRK